jgi:hypothetical protein
MTVVVRPSLFPLVVATTATVAGAQAVGPPATTAADGEQAAMTTDSTLFWEAKEDTGRGMICKGGGGGEGTTILVCNHKYVADEKARIGGGQSAGGWGNGFDDRRNEPYCQNCLRR